jgi:uncharacterized phage protein gp47/JayE
MTYDEILTKMKAQYSKLAGFNADDASDIGIRLKVLAAELAEFYTRLEELEKQIVPLTSTGVYLEYHAQAKAIFRKPAVKAAGKLRFSRETAASAEIVIPAGVVCSVSGDDPVTYITTADGKLAAGKTYVDIDAEAEYPGVSGNAAANAIKVMITPAAGITAVQNTAAFTGGAEAEGDDSLRERLLFSYKNLSNGTNSAYYYDTAMNHPSVKYAKVLPRNRGRGTVDVVIKCTSISGTAPAVAELQALFDRQKEINVDVRVMAASKASIDTRVEVTRKSEYAESEVKQNVHRAILDFYNSADIGQKMYLTDLGGKINAAEGVATYTITKPTADYTMTGTQVMDYGTVIVDMKAVV